MNQPATPPTALVAWSQDEADLIRQTLCPGATDGELRLFAQVAKSKGLSPFSGQIIMQIRTTKNGRRPVFLTTIDGARAKAARTGEYAGNDDATYEYASDNIAIQSASVTVWRLVKDVRVSFTATARWSEYVPDHDQMWRKMPHVMIAKCAEMLALRKAFPEELSDLHVKEEMDQADNQTPATEAPRPVASVTQQLAAKAATPAPSAADQLKARIAAAVRAFERFGKTPAEIAGKLGYKRVEEIVLEDLNGRLAAWYDELSREQEPPVEAQT